LRDSYTVRRAGLSDIPACAALHIASCLDVYRGYIPDEMHRTTLPENLSAIWAAETLPDEDFILIVEDAGQIIALATVRDRPVPYIDHFHVSPDRKGQGIGRLLMNALIAEMLRRGMTSMYLDFAEGNGVARDFYLAMGGQLGDAIEGDLFGISLPARTVNWPDLRTFQEIPAGERDVKTRI